MNSLHHKKTAAGEGRNVVLRAFYKNDNLVIPGESAREREATMEAMQQNLMDKKQAQQHTN